MTPDLPSPDSRPVRCRSCDTPLRRTFIDLGETPLANSYLDAEAAARPERRFPLHARLCEACFLVQVENAVPPEEIFSDYAYFSSYAASWVEHARRFVAHAIDRFGLGSDSNVVEIASNDGYLLRHFVQHGVPVLGIEPAANVAEAAEKAGVPTLVRFFGTETAREVRAARGAADLVVANNVLAHVPDLNDFVAGLSLILADDGVISVEAPHLLRLMEGTQFDTIYHEHFSYFSLLAIENVFRRHGLRVFDVQQLATHGGSLRVFACHEDSTAHGDGAGLSQVRDLEAEARLADPATYDGFAQRVAGVCSGFRAFLEQRRENGETVAAYGAAAKGNTFLNFCRIGTDLIDYVVDANPHKQGCLMPGSRLPIHAPEKLRETRPDYVVILPWNLKDEIVETMGHIAEWGGRFVVAIPRTEILP